MFSDVKLNSGDAFSRPTAGGGGYGDALERNPALVREDVADGYVSVRRAARDYGVVIRVIDEDLAEYEVDEAATLQERAGIRVARQGWLDEDPAQVAAWYQAGEVDTMDVLRRYGVLLNWGTGELLPRSTEQFRATMRRRAAGHWPEI